MIRPLASGYRLVVPLLLVAVLVSLLAPMSASQSAAAGPRVLMVVAYNQVWWAEYKVLYEALRAQGYSVDVRSSALGVAHSYGDSIDAVAGAPSSYDAFRALFLSNFGVAWDASWNAPQDIPLDGLLQDVSSMASYDALVIPGGLGMVAYRYDGAYAALGSAGHQSTAAEVEAAALRLNALIVEALQLGRPVAAQCHGAPTVAFARVPGTTGGPGGLGQSVLSGYYATGYPLGDGDTAASYASLGVLYLPGEKLVIDGPEAGDFQGNPNAHDLIITSADWYPQTVAYSARTLLNMLESYPSPQQRGATIRALVFGGDEPVNYPPQQPARYTDLVTLLNDPGDGLAISAVGTSQESAITLANLQQYDLLVYFRHNHIDEARQAAIEAYVDGGGGLVAIHHAIYNEGDLSDTLMSLIGGELPYGVSLNSELGLVYYNESNHMINVNLGHFVSTYGVHLLPGDLAQTVEYTTPLGLPNANVDGVAERGYYSFTIPASDELYLGNRFMPGVSFGSGVNQINRLFANDRFVQSSPNPNNGHYDTWGWTRVYDQDGDQRSGRIVYLQPGETNERVLSHPAYRQVIKNAVLWTTLSASAVVDQQLYLPLLQR